ncbi:MAG: sensor histidine kinase [Muricauda sp.]|nr:sensor histidine kinase [Allomuricauda sp.]
MKLTSPLKRKIVTIVCLLFLAQMSHSQVTETDSTRTALMDLLQDYEADNIGQSPESLVQLLEKARQLQNIGIKSEMKLLLDSIGPAMDFENFARKEFLYLLVQSRNELFHHEYAKALQHGEEALEHGNFSKPDELIYIYSTLATCHYYTSSYEKALASHLKALEICEKNPELDCLPGIFNNIGVVYMGTGDWKKAQEYTQSALDKSTITNNTFEQSRAIGNMAIIYAEQGDFDTAEAWFLKDLEIYLATGDSISAARNYNNLGRLNEMQQHYEKALSYYQKGLNLATSQNDSQSMALGYQNVGWMEHKTGNNAKALEFFGLGMALNKQLGNRDKLRDAYLNLSEFYSTINQPDKALEYFKNYHDLNDSIVGEERLKAISELEVKFETQQKENELLKLSKEKQEGELVIAKQDRRVRQLSFGLGAIALIGALGFVLFRQRLKNKKQHELILAISETQTEERKRIAQDLHDSIGGSLALTKSKFEVAKNKLSAPLPEMESALQTLEQTTNQVRQISHNLMPGELVRFGLVAAINTLLENLNEEEINAQFLSNQGEERLEPLKEIQLYRIVQEALQNVLKHAHAKNLFIQLNKHKEQLTLMIEDDGNGIVNSTHEGMGLKNIKQRVQLLKGVFSIDSAPNRGTILNIQIPV